MHVPLDSQVIASSGAQDGADCRVVGGTWLSEIYKEESKMLLKTPENTTLQVPSTGTQ